MPQARIVTPRSAGILDPRAWIDEADGLLASARVTRAAWRMKRSRFNLLLRSNRQRIPVTKWHELAGLPRASMLLAGYAIEMYLKAGIARAYKGCPEALLVRDLKSLYGHKLFSTAVAIDFAAADERRDQLHTLEKAILVEARYPVMPHNDRAFHELTNERTRQMWSGESFLMACRLAREIRDHVTRIDSDKTNPSIVRSYQVDNDGFLTYRMGGHLRPRITFRLSSTLRSHLEDGCHANDALGETSPDARMWCASELIRNVLADTQDCVLAQIWHDATVAYDDGKKTRIVRRDDGDSCETH